MKDGQMVAPGGIFIASDINKLQGQTTTESFTISSAGTELKPVTLTPYDGFDVEGKDARTYKRPDRQLKLFRQFQSAGRQAGLVD
jgi:hypothetical protein